MKGGNTVYRSRASERFAQQEVESRQLERARVYVHMHCTGGKRVCAVLRMGWILLMLQSAGPGGSQVCVVD